MPIAELAEALVVDDQTILPAGEQLTGQQAHDHWLQHQKPMKFRCVHCRLPLISVNIDNPNWKRTPHFRAHDNEEHTLPCVYAGESQPQTRAPATFEVADDKLKIPTKLVLKARRHRRAVPTHTTVPTSGEGGQREERHEEPTSYLVEDLCDVYFEKIKDCQSVTEYPQALAGLPLALPPGSRNIGYAEAFRNVASASLIHDEYRIFHGALRQVLKCRDGFLLSYALPATDARTWKPVAAHIPMEVLDEFDQGRQVERMLSQDRINAHPWAFLCGRPAWDGQGIVILLESVYWFHCTRHPLWHNPSVIVEDVQQSCQEVLPTLFAQQLEEFEQRSSNAGQQSTRGKSSVVVPPQQGQPVSPSDRVSPSPSTEVARTQEVLPPSSPTPAIPIEVPDTLRPPAQIAEEQRKREETRIGTGDDRARQSGRLATLEELEEWQGWQRADAQRDQHDRRRALDADQGLKKYQKEELWFQSYGQYRQAVQQKIQEIEAHQKRGGLWYRWFQKARDDQALADYKASIANSQWRETQARDALEKDLQHEREKLEEQFAKENDELERTIAQAFETRRIPEAEQPIHASR